MDHLILDYLLQKNLFSVTFFRTFRVDFSKYRFLKQSDDNHAKVSSKSAIVHYILEKLYFKQIELRWKQNIAYLIFLINYLIFQIKEVTQNYEILS
jgi:hypothetical protein